MSASPASARSTIVPGLRYRDARAAIDFLCEVFGFQTNLVVPNGSGGIAHAQLTLGGGMLMLGSVGGKSSAWADRIRQPDEIGGKETQSAYVVVADPDAVHARALAAGWEIVMAIKDEEHGGRGFTCADPEGHLWSVGSYDPWAEHG